MEKKALANEEQVILLLFIISSFVYFSSTNGLYGSNPGSHYSLVRSMVDNQTFKVNSFDIFTGYIDYAFYKNNSYSDRAPGLAFAVSPFYIAGKFIPTMLPVPFYFMGWDAGNPAVFFVLLFPVLAGAFSIVLYYKILRLLGASIYSSIITSLVLAFGTILWKYSMTIYSHSFSTFLHLSAIYLMLKLNDPRKQVWIAGPLFFVLGFMVLTEYANILLVIIIIGYLQYSKKYELQKITTLDKRYLIPFILLLLPILIIPAYNWINFDNPFTPAYHYSPHHPWVAKLNESLSTPLSEGLPAMIITSPKIDGGLFVLTPVLLLSLWGFYYMSKTNKKEAILFALLFLVHLLFYSKYKAFSGGAVRDTRYLLTVTPLLVAPLAFWIDRFLMKRKQILEKAFFDMVMWLLIIVSILNVMDDVGTEEGHNLREFIFPALSLSELKVDLIDVFPSLRRLPAFIGLFLVVYSIISSRIKRLIGFELTQETESNFNSIIGGLLIFGFVLIILTSIQPIGKGFSMGGWEFTRNNIEWFQSDFPIQSEENAMMVRGVLDVEPLAPVVLKVIAKDCIGKVFVNKRAVGEFRNCSICKHCNGGKVDLTRFVLPGLNSIGFEIKGFENKTGFSVEKAVT